MRTRSYVSYVWDILVILAVAALIALFAMALTGLSSISKTPEYGYVVSTYHNNSGYYIKYSDLGSLWDAKISYASYITCKPGMYWQGTQLEICTNTN